MIDKGEAKDGFSFFKVRMLLAACIFAAFVICDQTHTKFYQYSTQDVVKQITKNYDYDTISEMISANFPVVAENH